MNNMREKLADYAHDAQASWMEYMFRQSTLNEDGSVTIPRSLVERWEKAMPACAPACADGRQVPHADR